jgi:NADH-quinone oxidoreductase subunit M
VLLGAFRAWPVVSAIAALGVILAAIYILWMYQRVMFGPITNEKNRGLPDISKREFWTLAPVILFIIWIGVYPNTFLRKLDVSVSELLARAQAHTISMRTAPLLTPAAAPTAVPASEEGR